jgi:hypothetical protein
VQNPLICCDNDNNLEIRFKYQTCYSIGNLHSRYRLSLSTIILSISYIKYKNKSQESLQKTGFEILPKIAIQKYLNYTSYEILVVYINS